MNDADCFDPSHGFAMRRAARYISKLYERHLKAAALTPTQFAILARLSGGEKLTFCELTDTLLLDRTTLVRAASALRRARLVRAEATSDDARTLHFALTDEGRAAHRAARPLWDAAQQELEREFGRERAQGLRRELLELAKLGRR
ncbi:MarR family winged helix-turn-helix transcriptional regulator [Paraburkholderia kururiensis]|uniref:MarR family winged helix-turn-helix transcriptional regulator n=1 Tax=Paraburkholderia kururiensis TaxID=984307 RepID=UPI0018F7ADA4|nr:MarR family winged helix-turn-helix transcriptional regulator [Paraburkholderia kururiensis]